MNSFQISARTGLAGLAALVLAGCSSTWITRADYSLERFDDLLVTNSQTRFDQPKRSGGALNIQYSVILKNLSAGTEYLLPLQDARFQANAEAIPADCKAYSAPSSVSLKIAPGQTARVDCSIAVRATARNQLMTRDTVATLSIPYSNAGHPGSTSHLSLGYNLKIEDFE